MPMDTGDRDRLARGLTGMGLDAEEAVLDQLLGYARHLKKWNRSYNLVSAADIRQLVTRHLLDSISILPYLLPGSLLDVGTGAGFPGVPLAIMNPALDCTLLDSTGKKIRFLRHVKRELQLGNVHPVEMRAEDFGSSQKFDNITSRAFGSLLGFAGSVRHLAGPATRLLAMKGKHPETELHALPDWLQLICIEKLNVPDLRAERHLVMMSVSS
jgi:16S rRNA (guanine527-N7)-methyltransferase